MSFDGDAVELPVDPLVEDAHPLGRRGFEPGFWSGMVRPGRPVAVVREVSMDRQHYVLHHRYFKRYP